MQQDEIGVAALVQLPVGAAALRGVGGVAQLRRAGDVVGYPLQPLRYRRAGRKVDQHRRLASLRHLAPELVKDLRAATIEEVRLKQECGAQGHQVDSESIRRRPEYCTNRIQLSSSRREPAENHVPGRQEAVAE
jgi:hypothetical protein